MLNLKSAFAAATILIAACSAEEKPDDPIDYTSPDKPDVIAVPIGCAQAPADYYGGNAPSVKLTIGSRQFEAQEIFAAPAPENLRDQVIGDVAAVLLNLEGGTPVYDHVLVAAGQLEDWLVSTEFSDERVSAPTGPKTILLDYFDNLRPCSQQDDQADYFL